MFMTAMLEFDILFPFNLKVAGQTASFTSFYEQGMRGQDSLIGKKQKIVTLQIFLLHLENASTSSPRPPALPLQLQENLLSVWLRRAVLTASPSQVSDSSSQQLEIKADKWEMSHSKPAFIGRGIYDLSLGQQTINKK